MENVCGFESMQTKPGADYGKLFRCSLPREHDGDCRQDVPSGHVRDAIAESSKAASKLTACTPTKWCDALESVVNGENGHALGINAYCVVNTKTRAVRTLVGARSRSNKRGLFFTYCPFCGVRVNEIARPEASDV